MADPVDWSDPCAALAALRPVYYALLSGSQAETVEFANAQGAARRVTYTKVNLAALATEIGRLDGLCAAKTTGSRPRRHAIVGGWWGY